MANRDWRDVGRPVRDWTRKAMARIVPGDDDGPLISAEPAGPWLVDCAVYADGHRLSDLVDPYTALDLAHKTGGFAWLGVRDPSPEIFDQIAQAFGLHELAVEQAVTGPHRPKIERYGDVTLFVLRTTRYVEHAQLTETAEVVVPARYWSTSATGSLSRCATARPVN